MDNTLNILQLAYRNAQHLVGGFYLCGDNRLHLYNKANNKIYKFAVHNINNVSNDIKILELSYKYNRAFWSYIIISDFNVPIFCDCIVNHIGTYGRYEIFASEYNGDKTHLLIDRVQRKMVCRAKCSEVSMNEKQQLVVESDDSVIIHDQSGEITTL